MSDNRRRPEHPSGRPKERDNYRHLGFSRKPRDEPLSPGLRKRDFVHAVGFHAHVGGEQDE